MLTFLFKYNKYKFNFIVKKLFINEPTQSEKMYNITNTLEISVKKKFNVSII